jgi:hypothetical protein
MPIITLTKQDAMGSSEATPQGVGAPDETIVVKISGMLSDWQHTEELELDFARRLVALIRANGVS